MSAPLESAELTDADDIIILRAGYKIEASIKMLQPTINKLCKWGKTCGLSFNPTKTVVIPFSKKKLDVSKTKEFIKIEGNRFPSRKRLNIWVYILTVS